MTKYSINTIGVDYQQTLTVISLIEAYTMGVSQRLIGDGMRSLIPNGVNGTTWGSQAWLAQDRIGLQCGLSEQMGSWVQGPGASQFWHQLNRRLYTYLGRIDPIKANGYCTVVAVQSPDGVGIMDQVSRLCLESGWSDLQCVPAEDALLATWMTREGRTEQGERTVVVVAAGDTTTQVAAYRLNCVQGQMPRLMAVKRLGRVIHVGHALWVEHMLNEVYQRMSITPGDEFTLAMRDAVLVFATQLATRNYSTPVQWVGPLREHMYTSLQISRAECEEWPGRVLLRAELPRMIREATQGIDGGECPDVVMMGGVGAVWPFLRDAAVMVGGRLSISTHPQYDIANGAAWWPIACEEYATTLVAPCLCPGREGSAKSPSDNRIENDEDLLPYWMRKEETDPGILPPWERPTGNEEGGTRGR